jgi:hypothetical protein
MTNALTSMLAVPYSLGAVAVIVTDSGAGSPRTATFTAGVYRSFLALVAGTAGVNAGTEADPFEFVKYLQYKLNNNGGLALWTCALGVDGRIAITYGGTGTGTVQWDGTGGTSKLVKYAAGHDADISLAAAASVTCTYQPLGCAFWSGSGNDTGWTGLPQKFAAAEMPDGVVYGVGDNRHGLVRSFDLRHAPETWALRTTLATHSTPMFASTKARSASPVRSPATAAQAPPWSVEECFKTAASRRCGAALGNLQALIAGSDTVFEDVYLRPEMISAERAIRLSTPGYAALRDWAKVDLNWYATMAR